MKTLAGAIVILAAAILFSTGMVLVGMGNRSEGPGSIAAFVAAVVGMAARDEDLDRYGNLRLRCFD